MGSDLRPTIEAVKQELGMMPRRTAIVEANRAMREKTGNLPLLPSIYPDTMALVVRTAPDGSAN